MITYPQAEVILGNTPLHKLVIMEPVGEALHNTVTCIPDRNAIRRMLHAAGWSIRVTPQLMDQMEDHVQERLEILACL